MKCIRILLLLLCPTLSQAELQSLDESSLENVSGQTGVGISLDKLISIGSVTYSDEDATSGGTLIVEDIRIGDPLDVLSSSANSVHSIDIDGSEGLLLQSTFQPTRIQVGGISVGNHIGSRSFGQYIFDFEGTQYLNIKDGGNGNYSISSGASFKNTSFLWGTNGQWFRIDGLVIETAMTDALFSLQTIGPFTSGVNSTEAFLIDNALVIDIPTFRSDISISGICFNSSACSGGNSIGSFSNSLNLTNTQFKIHGGGREGAGIAFHAHFEFDTTIPGDGSFVSYTDDATIKFAQQAGVIDVTNLTFDIGRAEANIGDHVALQVDRVVGNFAIGDVSIAGNKVGAFEIQFDFSDGVHDSVTYQNKQYIAPGIAFAGYDFVADPVLQAAGLDVYMTNFYSKVTNTSDGVSLYNEWNLVADFIYTDDSHVLIADNYQTWGSGYLTLDVRSGLNSIDGTNDAAEDFLAIGVRDYKINYSLDGFKTGDQSAQLQSGYELLGFSPEAQFTLNAAIEIRGGGAVGSGVTFDGDVLITEGNFAFTKNGSTGIYLDGITYDFHFRDVTMDVDNGGIQIVLGDIWSEMDITDIRFGDKKSGESIGAINVKQYQTGSQLTINGGGAASGCVGGSGVDAAACDADGGFWLDAGSEGLTIASKSILNQRSGTKENSVTWTTNRAPNGLSMKLDNIYTSDGYDDASNTHGIQNTLTVDVAKTRVVKKETGIDSNGKAGNAGDELIMNGSDYDYVAVPSPAQKSNRPETLVLSNNVQIKELNIDAVQLQHSNALATPDTMLNGIKLQNLNLRSTLSVSPIR